MMLQEPDFTYRSSTRWWPGIGRWWVLHTQAEIFSGIFTLPVNGYALLGWMKHGNSTRSGTFFNTTAAVPAFFGVKDQGRFTLFRVRHHYIIRANLYTEITPAANIRVELNCPVWHWWVWHHIYFITHLLLTPF